MKVFYDKIEKFRKEHKYTLNRLCSELGIARGTFWSWKRGIRNPGETKIRHIAEILNEPVNKISDLKPEYPKSDQNISLFEESWNALSQPNRTGHINYTNKLIEELKNQQNELWQATFMIKSLLSSLQVMFYIKDLTLKYVIANEAFLENISLNKNYNVKLQDDINFFPKTEAEFNSKEDFEILRTGKSIINIERIIPGSRKKKWGLISKYPIYDCDRKITGLIGTFVDITERKKSEIKRELLEMQIDSISEGIAITENYNEYLYLNKAREIIFGYSNELVYKGGVDFIINTCIHPDDREKEQKFLSADMPPVRHYRIIRPDGGIRLLESRSRLVEHNGKKYSFSICIDITDES
ncbi:MAG TPA: PAS domain S-box protein [Victivallales bacterium]|nr:PAS domain S-box protein [Victivallales bacterium]